MVTRLPDGIGAGVLALLALAAPASAQLARIDGLKVIDADGKTVGCWLGWDKELEGVTLNEPVLLFSIDDRVIGLRARPDGLHALVDGHLQYPTNDCSGTAYLDDPARRFVEHGAAQLPGPVLYVGDRVASVFLNIQSFLAEDGSCTLGPIGAKPVVPAIPLLDLGTQFRAPFRVVPGCAGLALIGLPGPIFPGITSVPGGGLGGRARVDPLTGSSATPETGVTVEDGDCEP